MTNAPAREGWFSSDGLRLRYVEWGAPTAPAIVALHGLRSFGYTWEPLARHLEGRFRLIALDQRGRGESDWDPRRRYYTSEYVRDLERLVDWLGLERFILLGHSMGGATAFVYASRHPDRLAGLVIEEMGPGSSAQSSGADRIRRELLQTPAKFENWDEAAVYWRKQRPNISESAVQARVKHSMKQAADGHIEWRHDANGIAQARLNATPEQLVDLWPHIEAVSTPTLLVRGARSDFLSEQTAEEMARRNSRIACLTVAGATHYVHDDNFEAFKAALDPFLDAFMRPGMSRHSMPAA